MAKSGDAPTLDEAAGMIPAPAQEHFDLAAVLLGGRDGIVLLIAHLLDRLHTLENRIGL